MIAAGIDPSLTSTGLGILHDGNPIHHSRHGHRARKNSGTYLIRNRRIRYETNAVTTILTKHRPDIAVIEIMPPANRGNFMGRDDRAALINGIIGWLDYQEIPIVFLYPSSVKAWGTGNGRADKLEMIETVNTWHPTLKLEEHQDDEADALILGHIGAYRLGDPMPFPIKRRHPHIFDVGDWPSNLVAKQDIQQVPSPDTLVTAGLMTDIPPCSCRTGAVSQVCVHHGPAWQRIRHNV